MRFLSWSRRRRREDQLEEEIKSHLEMAAHDLRERGQTAERARADAHRQFGNIGLVKEATRAMWGWVWLKQLGQDLRYAIRVLRRSPGFTAVVLMSLALGIGANTAIFSVLDALILRTLPVRGPSELVILKRDPGTMKSGNFTSFRLSPDLQQYRDLVQVFSGVSAIVDVDRSNVMTSGPGGGRDPEQVRIQLVTGDYFSTFGVTPAAGRTLTADDDSVPGGHPVAVISDSYWTRRFGRTADVVGRTITLNGTTYTILGVTAPGFSGDWVGRSVDLWIPMAMYSAVMSTPLSDPIYVFRIVARLKPGVAREQAQAALDVVSPGLAEEYLVANPQMAPWRVQYEKARIVPEPGARGYSPQRDLLAQPLSILLLMVGLVLLIACANVANLLLGRAAARHREMAVRLAIGACRARIIRQLLTESVILAILGGVLGLLFAVWATRAILSFVGSGPAGYGGMFGLNSIYLDVRPDARLLALTATVCLLTGILFGLAPAVRASRASVGPLSGRGHASGGPGGRFAVSKLLVVAQVALSLVLLIGAGLFVRTLSNLKSQDLGYDREHLLLVWTAPGQTNRQDAALAGLADEVRRRIEQVPGVIAASPSSAGLLNGTDPKLFGTSAAINLQGEPPRPGMRVARSVVSPGFFATVGMELLQGRDFAEWDTASSAPVAIVNETLARFEFGDENPIGKHIGILSDVGTPRQVVGMVKDAKKYNNLRDDKLGMIYLSYRQRPSDLNSMCLVVRTAGNPLAVAAQVRQELRELDSSLPILKIDTIDEQLKLTLVKERLIVLFAEFFGILSMLLACLGLYGVIAYTVARRTGELGIRMALGARRGDMLGMVFGESLLLVLLGIAIGIPAALSGSRVIASLLFDVSATDPLAIVAATLLMIAVAALAAYLPARRASRVDPMVALRYE